MIIIIIIIIIIIVIIIIIIVILITRSLVKAYASCWTQRTPLARTGAFSLSRWALLTKSVIIIISMVMIIIVVIIVVIVIIMVIIVIDQVPKLDVGSGAYSQTARLLDEWANQPDSSIGIVIIIDDD